METEKERNKAILFRNQHNTIELIGNDSHLKSYVSAEAAAKYYKKHAKFYGYRDNEIRVANYLKKEYPGLFK